jgi:hypothetical protein
MSLMDAVKKIKTVAELLDDNDPDKTEMLNVEGDYDALMKWALIKIQEHKAQQEATDLLIERYTKRKMSYKNKEGSMRDIVQMIMDAANETKFTCEAGSASISHKKPLPVVFDENLIPDEFFKYEKKLVKSRINKSIEDGKEIQGVTMSNGGITLTIR